MAIKTSNSSLYAPFEINRIISKKIANLCAADEPKPRRKRPRKIKAASALSNVDEGNDENVEEEQIEGDDETSEVVKLNNEHNHGNKEREHNEEQDLENMQNEYTEESNQVNYELENKSIEVNHARNIAPTEDIEILINGDDIPYYILNMPDLTDTINWSFNDI